MNSSSNITLQENLPHNGYHLRLVGLESGDFSQLHIITLCCIFMSLTCAIAVLIMSFRDNKGKRFADWREVDRFVTYIALCDGAFNIFHSMDHIHVFVTQDHIRPKVLCQVYAFLLIEFIEAQVLMVKMVAINMFALIYFNKKLNFGRFDWKLLLWMFIVPTATNIVALANDALGPNGAL